MSLACLLIGCGPSRTVTPPLRLPTPPSEAMQACQIPALMGGSAADVEAALIERGAAIAACEARRAALVSAWPR
jgi:hypothetical protein